MAFIQGTSGPDVLNDTAAADVILAGGGDDEIRSSGTGSTDATVSDVVEGGTGLDTLVVNHVTNAAFRSLGHSANLLDGGFDGRLWGGNGYVDYVSIERFVITSGSGSDEIETYGGDDVVNSGSGFDIVHTGAGNDTITSTSSGGLYGEAGNDTYFVNTAGNVFETAGGGFDTVYVNVTDTLPFGIEIERFALADAASTVARNLTGNSFAQELIGNAGINTLTGGEGPGDVLIGLGGNDAYVVKTGDQIIETAGGGSDTARATGNFALNAGAVVETIRFDFSTTGAFSLTGNELFQVITGNSSANQLSSGGGGDIMIGAGGDDFYLIVGLDDYIIEDPQIGDHDVAMTNVTYQLHLFAEVELLQTTTASTSAITLVGNAYQQTITGNQGNNFINSLGGGDILYGYAGNDIYYVGSGLDEVHEAPGEGMDEVRANVSYALTAGESIEILGTQLDAGTAAINLSGNELAQLVLGNAGANRLNGGGGADLLMGLAGADTFIFASTLGSGNIDTILDFEAGVDRFELSLARFTGLAPGALPAGAFVVGTQAGDADDRIIYDSSTGALYFDADGSGSGAQIQFASLAGAPTLTSADFQVI